MLPLESSNEAAPLRLELFGGLRATRQAQPCLLPGSLAQRLVAYLALHRGHQPREVIAEAIWPNLPPGQGRRHLSDQLYQLKKALGEGWILAEPDTLALAQERLKVDLWQFNRLLEQEGEQSTRRAVQLYRGDLLPSLYDDWVLMRRLAARESYLDALQRLGELELRAGRPTQAASAFQRLVQEDPLRESAVRGRMRALAAAGRIPQALHAYRELEQLLRQELEAAPSEETQELLQQLERELSARQQSPPLPSKQLPFVGRARERSAALDLVERAVDGAGGALAFEGPPGIGKTRLLREIESGARWRGAAVAWGSAPQQPSHPYQALAESLSAAFKNPGWQAAERMVPPATLAALAPLRPEWADLAQLPAVPPDLTFDRLAQALAEVWVKLAQVQPMVLVLDDMHWAAPDQWRALEPLLRALPASSLVLLFAYRRQETERSPTWPALLDWERAGWIDVMPLSALTAQNIARLLPARRADEAERLARRTGGIPLYVVEALSDTSSPASGDDPWSGRAGELAAADRAALDAAAVLGDGFDFDTWREVSGLSPEELARAAVRLVHDGFLVDDQGYRFAHDLVRESIYRLLPSPQAQQLHQQAVAVLTRNEQTSHDRSAHHLAQAGRDREAAASYLKAGAQSMDHNAPGEAAGYFQRGLDLAPKDSAELRYQLASHLARALEYDPDPELRAAALGAASEAAEQLQEPGRKIEVLLAKSDLRAREGDLDAAKAAIQQARELNQELQDPQFDLRLESGQGDLALRLGDPKAASLSFRRAVEQADQLGARSEQGRALDGLAFSMASLGATFEEISQHFEDALALFRQEQDAFNEARTLLNYFSACQNASKWEEMEAMAPQVFAALERVGYRLGEGIAHQAYGLAACYRGDLDAAERHLSLAAERFRQADDALAVSLATTGLGQVLRRRGDNSRAESRLREARRLAQRAQAGVGVAFAEQELAVLLIESGRFQEAQELLQAAISVWEKAGDPGNRDLCRAALALCRLEGGDRAAAEKAAEQLLASLPPPQQPIEGEEPQVRLWFLYQLLRDLGCGDDAHEVLERAVTELMRQARLLSEPEARRRMLLELPTNRRLSLAWLKATSVDTHKQWVLAAAEAPLGRPLQPEEQVTVRWTLVSPEDETIGDPVSRRRYVLRRLLHEAAQAGAAPTDGQLAEALGVSRRTILRDMRALERSGHQAATRGRSPR